MCHDPDGARVPDLIARLDRSRRGGSPQSPVQDFLKLARIEEPTRHLKAWERLTPSTIARAARRRAPKASTPPRDAARKQEREE